LFLVGEKETCRISEERAGTFRKWLRENLAQLPQRDETKDSVLLSALEGLPTQDFKTKTPVCNPDLEQSFLRTLTSRSSGSFKLEGGPLEPALDVLRLVGMATMPSEAAYRCFGMVYDVVNRLDNYLLNRRCNR
jgi:hypothetical protein